MSRHPFAQDSLTYGEAGIGGAPTLAPAVPGRHSSLEAFFRDLTRLHLESIVENEWPPSRDDHAEWLAMLAVKHVLPVYEAFDQGRTLWSSPGTSQPRIHQANCRQNCGFFRHVRSDSLPHVHWLRCTRIEIAQSL